MTNLIIIDASGSMSSLINDVRGGIKQTFDDIKEADKDPSLFKHTKKKEKSRTIVYDFSERPVLLCDESDSDKLDYSIADKYRTRGSTALYDAIGEAFAKVNPEEKKVMVTIITDGEENSSRNFSGNQIKEIIEGKKAAGWAILFIGADEKCINTAHRLGVSAGNTMAFTNTAGAYAGASALLGDEKRKKKGSNSSMYYARSMYMASEDALAQADLLEESEKFRLSNDKKLGLLSEEDEKEALSNLQAGKKKIGDLNQTK